MEIQANILGSAILMPDGASQESVLPYAGGQGQRCAGNGYGVIVPGIQAGHADQAGKPSSDLIPFAVVFTKKRTVWGGIANASYIYPSADLSMV